MFRLLLILWFALAVSPGQASELDRVVDALTQIEVGTAELSVRDVRDGTVQVGEPLRYDIKSNHDGHLTLIVLDSHGVATLYLPGDLGDAGRLSADQAVQLPNPESVAFQTASLPGRHVAFALLTQKPIVHQELGYFATSERPSIIDSDDGVAFAQQLRKVAKLSGVLAADRVMTEVAGSPSSDQIVAFFTSPTTRALRRPSIDVYINFDFDSADIASSSEGVAQAIADALQDEALGGTRFRIGGHADDIGESSYNLELSRRRAQAMRAFLVQEGLDPKRFSIEAFGEDRPLVPGADEKARAANRRVELILER